MRQGKPLLRSILKTNTRKSSVDSLWNDFENETRIKSAEIICENETRKNGAQNDCEIKIKKVSAEAIIIKIKCRWTSGKYLWNWNMDNLHVERLWNQ